MPRARPFNLFVYGTLMDATVFRAVLGLRFVFSASQVDGVSTVLARDAVLEKYKKISPDNTYLYAVPDPHGRIKGYLIGPLPGECMKALRHYEGSNYSRQKVHVHVGGGPMEDAYAFVGSIKRLEHAFGYAFHDPFKQEVLLREKIERALAAEERQKLHTDEPVMRRAVAELMGATIRDLVRRHFEAGGISDYAIRQSLGESALRDFSRVVGDAEAAALAPNYLAMVVRQVIFNELEERIQNDFHYELDQLHIGQHYYERTISSLTALRVLNQNSQLLSIILGDAMADLRFQRDHLVDYVRWAIIAADAIFEPRLIRRELTYITTHMSRGAIPLGAELEFSNIGNEIIRDPRGNEIRDVRYDGFLYFTDFALDALTWKLGGHVDDHYEKASRRRRRGFFEVALGSVSIEDNLSKPITDDPWLLNQFIQEARRFFDIAPHSVHISLQLRSQHRPVRDRLLPLAVLKCLFALAGDPLRQEDGSVRIGRLAGEEIVRADAPLRGRTGPSSRRMLFSEISKRRSAEAGELSRQLRGDRQATTGMYVQQYKFLRLSAQINYEPIVMALKGIQLSLSPGNFMTPAQYAASRKHRETFEALQAWGRRAAAIPAADIDEFLKHVHDGLCKEYGGKKPAHPGAYIAWSLSQLRTMLGQFNEMVGLNGSSQFAVHSSQ